MTTAPSTPRRANRILLCDEVRFIVASGEARIYNRSAARTTFNTLLFVTEGDHGVDASGAAGGNVAGEDGDGGHY